MSKWILRSNNEIDLSEQKSYPTNIFFKSNNLKIYNY